MDHLIVEFAGNFAMCSSFALAGLADTEYQKPGALAVGFENVAGLADEIGDIYGGQRIGAFEHQRVARNELAEHLAGLERGEGATQSAQIERLFGHGSSPARIEQRVKGACLTAARVAAKVRRRRIQCTSPRESRVTCGGLRSRLALFCRFHRPVRRRSCAGTAARCGRWRSRPTARPRSRGASIKRRLFGRLPAKRPSRCCASMTARSMPRSCSRTAAPPPPARTGAS